MPFKKIALLFVVFSGFVSIVQADNLYNAYQGQYLSVNAGATLANKIFQSNVTKRGVLGAGGNLFLGTTINPYVAAEVGGQYYSFGSWGGVAIMSINGRLTVPVGSRISLFAKLGIGYAEVVTRLLGPNRGDLVSDNTVPVFGLGVGYGLTSLWMLSLEANGAYFSGSTNNASGLMGGLTFGGTRYFNT